MSRLSSYLRGGNVFPCRAQKHGKLRGVKAVQTLYHNAVAFLVWLNKIPFFSLKHFFNFANIIGVVKFARNGGAKFVVYAAAFYVLDAF